MRTATTLAKTHKGEWKLVAGPEVPITEQKQDYRGLLGTRTHPEFAEIRFQESDGPMQALRLEPEPKKAKAKE